MRLKNIYFGQIEAHTPLHASPNSWTYGRTDGPTD